MKKTTGRQANRFSIVSSSTRPKRLDFYNTKLFVITGLISNNGLHGAADFFRFGSRLIKFYGDMSKEDSGLLGYPPPVSIPEPLYRLY